MYTYQGEDQIVNIKYPLFEFDYENKKIEPGHYSDPFTFQLPDWLPSSMKVKQEAENLTISVSYSLKVHYEGI